MEEIWKDIPGYEGKYQVSSMGNVKSLSRTIHSSNQYGEFEFQINLDTEDIPQIRPLLQNLLKIGV